MDWPLYFKHRLTAFHWRENHGGAPTRIAVCSCGWRDRLMRLGLISRVRRIVCTVDPRGHRWGDPEEWSFGPLGHVVGVDDDAHGTMVVCDRCYATKDL